MVSGARDRTRGRRLFLVNRYVAVLGHLPLFYISFGGSCNSSTRVSPNYSVSWCSLIPSASTCESRTTTYSWALAADRYRVLLGASYHSILVLVTTFLTAG